MVESIIFRESEAERQTANAVRTELLERLRRGEPREELAERLGLVPVGLDALTNRYWTLEEAFRVALALDIEFDVKRPPAERAA